jgi:hypothetical protein
LYRHVTDTNGNKTTNTAQKMFHYKQNMGSTAQKTSVST